MIVAVSVLCVVVIGGFLFWIAGGFDLFKQPVEIVIPAGYSGVVCARLLPGAELALATRYEVAPNGLLPVSEEVMRSHRKLHFLSKSQGNSGLAPLPNDAMFPIFSETDLANNASFTVFWVGALGSWTQYNASRAHTPLCVGRY